MFFSAEMFRIYGFEPADHPPSYEAMLGRAHPDDAPNVDAAVTEALRTGTELRLLTRIRIPGQPVKWVEAYGHPVREDGRVVEFIGTVIDVTERVRANRRGRRAIETRYEAVIAERTRIARDMHDGLLQDVAGIAMQLDAVLPHIRDEAVAARVRHILALTERTGRDARLAVVDMREQSDSVDLAAAVQDEARRTIAPAGLPFTVRVTGPVRLVSTRVCEAAVSVMHEAVTNALKHAAAQWITVSVVFRRRTVRLSLRDDGRGLTPAPNDGDSAGRIGLIGMRERAATVGATLRVSSIPGRGTTVRLDVPLGR
jgi:signal transduction histidine kinase